MLLKFPQKVDCCIDSSSTKVKMNMLYTNTSEEGTKDSLIVEIYKLERAINSDLFLISICYLHTMNLIMYFSIKINLEVVESLAILPSKYNIPVIYYRKS